MVDAFRVNRKRGGDKGLFGPVGDPRGDSGDYLLPLFYCLCIRSSDSMVRGMLVLLWSDLPCILAGLIFGPRG